MSSDQQPTTTDPAPDPPATAVRNKTDTCYMCDRTMGRERFAEARRNMYEYLCDDCFREPPGPPGGVVMAEMNKRNAPEHAASVVWYECPNRCGYDVEWYDDNSGTWCHGCCWAGWGDELARGVTPGGLEHSTGTAMVMYDAKDRESEGGTP